MNFQKSNLIKDTGAYAFAEVDKLVDNLKQKGIKPIDFGVGDPSSPTPDFINKSGKQGIEDFKSAGYPSYIGDANFLEACSSYMKKNFQVDLDPKTEITSTIGSKEAVFHLPFGFINPGDTVIIPTPGYPPMLTGTRFAYGKPYIVGLFEENNFMIDYESIPSEVAEKAVIMWVNYPNSPTGKSASLDYYRGLVAWAQKYNIIIAADEGCYIDIYFGNDKPHSILEVQKEGIITFYSLSKRNNMTGWRIGFVAGDQNLVEVFRKVKTNIDSGTPNFIQKAAITALNDDDHAQEMRDEYLLKKNILLETLSSVGFPKMEVDATFYVWQKAPNNMNGLDLAKKLLDEKIAVVTTPGAWISSKDDILNKNPGENFVRFALVPTVEEVKEACLRIKANF